MLKFICVLALVPLSYGEDPAAFIQQLKAGHSPRVPTFIVPAARPSAKTFYPLANFLIPLQPVDDKHGKAKTATPKVPFVPADHEGKIPDLPTLLAYLQYHALAAQLAQHSAHHAHAHAPVHHAKEKPVAIKDKPKENEVTSDHHATLYSKPNLSDLVYAKYYSYKYYPGYPVAYKFEYGVKDLQTGDHKSHCEHKDQNQHVKGSYELVEPDGSKRLVKYSTLGHSGFQAFINKEGIYQHPHGGRSFHNFNFHH